MDLQEQKPTHQQIMIAQREAEPLHWQAILGEVGKIDRLPLLWAWMGGYGELTDEQRLNPKPGQKITLVRRSAKPFPNIYLYEHKPAPVPEWKAFKKLLSNSQVGDLKPEQIKQIPSILNDFKIPPCLITRMEYGGRIGLLAFRKQNPGTATARAFFFVSDPARRIIEEVGENMSGATEQEKHELDDMFGRINFFPENAKPRTERGVR